MTTTRVLALALSLALPCGAWGQSLELVAQGQQEQKTEDEPRGAPYNTGAVDRSGVSLRDYLSSRIDQLRSEVFDRLEQLDRANANALSAAKEAVIKAENAMEKRFDSVNEFRGQLDDQASTFMPKSEANVRFNALEEKVINLTNRLDATKSVGEGRNDTWALVAALAAIVLAAIGALMAYNKQRPVAR